MKKTIIISFFICILVQTAFAAIPDLVRKDIADTKQMSNAHVLKNSSFKTVPNPQRWEYVFSDSNNRDYWLDKNSIDVSPDGQIIRFSFINSYIADYSNISTFGLSKAEPRYRFGFAILDYEENTFTVKKQNIYSSDIINTKNLRSSDLRDYVQDYTSKELGREQHIEANNMTGKFSEILRPYLTKQPIENKTPKVQSHPKQSNSNIKFI